MDFVHVMGEKNEKVGLIYFAMSYKLSAADIEKKWRKIMRNTHLEP